MIVDSKEALALMDKIEKGTPKFCNPVPSREDWERLRVLLNTPPTPQLAGNFGHIERREPCNACGTSQDPYAYCTAHDWHKG